MPDYTTYFILIIILIRINIKYYTKLIRKKKGTRELERLRYSINLLSRGLRKEGGLEDKYK